MMVAFALLGINILTTVASQLLFKQGISSFEGGEISLSNIWSLIKFIITNAYLILGMGLYAVSFLLWLMILEKLDLSLVYPMSSLNFVLVAVFSWYFLGEQMDVWRLLGIAFIILGVLILFKSV